jgi:hypothetical protein
MVHSRIILYGTGLSNTDRLSIEKYLSEKYYLAVTEVNDLKNQNIPRGFILNQNYPNPFNPSTTIQFSVPNSEIVQLKVFDILGRVVKTLVNGYRNAGKYNIEFNASELTSGIYFYQLKTSSFISTKKMILLK